MENCKSHADFLPINFALLSKLVSDAQRPYDSIYFAEMAGESQNCLDFRRRRLCLEWLEEGRLLDYTTINSGANNQLSKALSSSFIMLQDSFSLRGLGHNALVHKNSRLYLAKEAKDWDRILTLICRSKHPVDYCQTLLNICGDMKNGPESGRDTPQSVKYGAAWKLARWQSLPLPKRADSFDEQLFGIFSSLRDNDWNLAMNSLQNAANCLLDFASNYPTPDNALIDQQKMICHLDFLVSNTQQNGLVKTVANINSRLASRPPVDEHLLEAVTAIDYAFLSTLIPVKNCPKKHSFVENNNNNNNILSCEPSLLLETECDLLVRRMGYLRKEKKFSMIQQLSTNWTNLVNVHGRELNEAVKLRPDFAQAKALLSQNETSLAVHTIRQIVSKLMPIYSRQQDENDSADSDFRTATLLSQCNAFLGTNSTSANCSQYLHEACNVLEMFNKTDKDNYSFEIARRLGKSNYRLGLYMDRRYRSLKAYIASEHFEWKKSAVKVYQNVLKADKETGEVGETNRKRMSTVSEQLQADKEKIARINRESNAEKLEISKTDEECRSKLVSAVDRYLMTLRLSNDFDVCVYRLMDLWIGNLAEDELTVNINNQLDYIPTFKWLPVWNQLCALIGTTDSVLFKRKFPQMIVKIAHDHPYHTVNQLLYMINLNKDESKMSRIESARIILKELLTSDKGSIVRQMLEANKAYAQFFSYTTQHDGLIASGAKILNLPKMAIPIPTITLPIDKSAQYSKSDQMKCFANIEPKFHVAGGKSRPKVIKVWASDGILRRVIFKMGEDLRQDTLIEQVFAVSNELLLSCQCIERVQMRTYNVLPVNEKCGLIEWCEGTLSLAEYSIGLNRVSGAHGRYFPSEIDSLEARRRLKMARKTNATKEGDVGKQLQKAFEEINEQFSPVLRYFFLEHFPQSVVWHSRRRAYALSAAVWSIVCHVVGLGDRHALNILMDERSAELVHIDLGMVFEYARRALPIPERVPFRLTRDFVDPMGICGVEGVFRHMCIQMLSILRANADILLSVISVLLHDPVSDFEMPLKYRHLLTSTNEGGGKVYMARTAVGRVRDKLNGRETSDKTEMSVPQQVDYLIAEARNPENLALIYDGWMPFL